MTGPALDLDALRKALARGEFIDLDDVFALVEEQRDRISTLEEALEKILGCNDRWARMVASSALYDGSPAENKEPLALEGLEWAWEYEPFEKRLTVRARIRGQSVWRVVFVIDQAELT